MRLIVSPNFLAFAIFPILGLEVSFAFEIST